MLKVVLFFAICFLKLSISNAQSDENPSKLIPNKLYIGIGGIVLFNFSAFSGNSFIDNGLNKPPFLTRSFGVLLKQNLTKQLTIETGISTINIGYKSVFTSNYQGGRKWRANDVSTNYFGLLCIPVKINYFIPVKNTRLRKYISLGTGIYYNPNSDLTGRIMTKGAFTNSYTGDKFTFTDYRYPSPRLTPTLLVGIGLEKDIGKKGIVNLGIIYNQGFKNIAVWDTEYKTWDISENVDGILFRNMIVNKATYIGLQVSFLFALL
jgi:hypothetical protein